MSKAIMTSKTAYMHGLWDSVPIVLGYLPVAVAFGVSARGAELDASLSLLVSILVFAGGSQFALVELIKGGASLMTTVLISLGLNLRHVLYGPAIAPLLKGTGRQKIPLISFGLTDEVFATALVRLRQIQPDSRTWWLLGIQTGAYSSWVIGTWIGSVGSAALLDLSPLLAPALNFAPAALFFGLLLPMLKKHTLIPIVAVVLTTLAFNLAGLSAYGIIAAAVVGPLAGLSGSKLWKKS
ncbi:AzlC family ABC transporter permease [Desulfohalobiaceae bacterium Ax17]|uniref:AzlC family ABC transporter permease n=1 Tax=Desulfovulcanus ferrireducens TaxID=2831190 RepID=UPI00207BCB1C|nr:AzlC family ABC transporter permease [Desulfovulcanus ferrireducens]MBT8764445.1 AzlC family ABC transporter permease [Desulfovulcanus ferrireducens]